MMADKTFLTQYDVFKTRNLLAYFIIGLSFIALGFVSYSYFELAKANAAEKEEIGDKIFSTLIPLFATWIGTVLAFYFGRKNFQAATNALLTTLTPDLLDDVEIGQIMITKKTLVGKPLQEIKQMTVPEIIVFLQQVDKSRLPIFENNRIKYIIHEKTFLEANNRHQNQPQIDASKTPSAPAQNESTQPLKQQPSALTFDEFVKKHGNVITSFLEIEVNKKLEDARDLLQKNPSVKDLFVKNRNNETIGWLTDTLIFRFIKE